MPDYDNNQLNLLVQKRIAILDGAIGTLIQSYNLTETDFRGKRYTDYPTDLSGNNDIISLTRPELVEEIHRAYLTAGADIIKTNTFTANSISQADYNTEHDVYDMNFASAVLARKVADEFTALNPHRPRFIAGSIGPTNRTCSISPDIDNPGFRNITFDELRQSYFVQAKALLDGGIDVFLIETVFDTLNARAALFAIKELLSERGVDVPIWVSGTITDDTGRTLSGQTTEAFWISVSHADLFCVGLNCALGAGALRPYVEELSKVADTLVSVHPNAGLPDENGNYTQSPSEMAELLEEFARSGFINIAGGCCGTTPEHIKQIARAVKGIPPRKIPQVERYCRLSGLEPLIIKPDSLFVNIGERTNVMGSVKFARLIKQDKYEEALEIALQQVQSGAQIIDINTDEAMLDSKKTMVEFLKHIASVPQISRVPVMIDSSDWDVIEAGLKYLQGKGIVNSISLKDGIDEFKRKANLIRWYGAAVIVMAFDENGQAETFDSKVEICSRSYRILTEEVGFPPEDIIFDPNIFAIATGIEEHNNYAVDYINACKMIKKTLPYSLVSGGVSNLSFAFRGNNTVREAMHSVFLYHAIQAGMDMGIVNAGKLPVYDEIPENLREIVEDVILNRRNDAVGKLAKLAISLKDKTTKKSDSPDWRNRTIEERLKYALINGIIKHIATDVKEALEKYENPVTVVEGPLMAGMNTVGELFGAGKMFLPQVVRTARVMKKAVSVLLPYLESEKIQTKAKSKGKILLATVKGDVHDIGKNIAAVVLECNNYEIIDLGVMVPAGKILDAARQEDVDIIGLSGLITPSLEEMVHIASEMERQDFDLPLLIGGATTSKVHTSVKIAPEYHGTTIYIPDAPQAARIVNELFDNNRRSGLENKIKLEQQQIRDKQNQKQSSNKLLTFSETRKKVISIDWKNYTPKRPEYMGITVFKQYPLDELEKYINWTAFFHAWELRGRYPKILKNSKFDSQAKKLFDDACKMLKDIINEQRLKARAVIGLFPANSAGDDIEIYSDDSRRHTIAVIHNLRQQMKKTEGMFNSCLSDFIAPKETGVKDYIGAFAVSSGFGIETLLTEYQNRQDDYNPIMIKALADRLADALAERIHQRIRNEFWGYASDEILNLEDLFKGKYVGIRPAPGYPSCPDHTEKRLLFDLLDMENNIGINLTENYAMQPASSVSGWYFSHPKSHYFSLGKIGEDQITDYAGRKGMSVAEVKRWLKPNLFQSTLKEK